MITALLMVYAAGAGFTLAILLDYVIADWKDLLVLVLAVLLWPWFWRCRSSPSPNLLAGGVIPDFEFKIKLLGAIFFVAAMVMLGAS